MTPQEKSWKDRLYQAEADYPSDMWERIAVNLPPQKAKNKRRFLPFLFLGFTLIVITSSIYILTGNPDKQNSNQGIDSIVNLVDQKQTFSSTSTENYREKEISEIVDSKSQKNNNTNIYTSKSDINKKTFNRIFDNVSQNKIIQNSSLNSISTAIESSNNTPVINEIEITDNDKNNVLEHSRHELIRSEDSRFLMSPLPVLPALNRVPEQYFHQFPAPECPSFYNDQAGMYLDFYFSHEYGFRELSPKNTVLQSYASQRDSTESGQYSFSAGARISFILPSGWGVKSGINYSQINEKFSFTDPDDSMTETVIVIDTVLINGIPTAVSDTTTTTIPGTTEITTYNKYRFIDIPILATYEAPLNDRWYFNVNGGVLFNLTFSQKGRFLDEAGEPVWFTSSRADRVEAYKMSVGLSFYGSLALHYVWNDHFDLFLEPNFRYYTGSLTTEEYGLNQKYLTTGLMTGVRYKF